MANKTVKVDIASVLLQEAAKVGDFVLQYQTMNDIWTFRYIDLMQEDEFFIAPTAQDVLVSAIAHGNNPDWLDEKVPTQQSAQQSVQRTANAASQQASFITDGVLPSKARGATRRR